jgi:dTDP-4-dehydrorhamnose 3,5-epimerase
LTIDLLPLRGALLLRNEVHRDDRGSFRRIVDLQEMNAAGGDDTVVQVSAAVNGMAGTLRGLHYQTEPHQESKTLWCSKGSVFDVLVDLRPEESTYGTWIAVNLTAVENVGLHVPPGVAHGYQTLQDDTELVYLVSAPHHPESARILRWSDPTVGIAWPLPVTHISDRDREAPSWPPQS